MKRRHLLVLALLMGGVELPPLPARRPPDEPEPEPEPAPPVHPAPDEETSA